MMVQTRKGKAGDIDHRQIDDEVIDIDDNGAYPILEKTNNALLWPEEIKGGIDLSDYEAEIVTEIPAHPYEPLQAIRFHNSDTNI